MGAISFKIQEASPWIKYSAGWFEASDSDHINDGTYRVTSTPGSSATVSFLGRGVAFFGAFQPDHGSYTVTLDDTPPGDLNSNTLNDTLQQSLIAWTGLEYKVHNASITNKPTSLGSTLNIEFITIERQIGSAEEEIHNITLDDSSSSVKYTGQWSSISEETASNNTLHHTVNAGSTFSIAFQGCCIELYGQYANANYTVVVDDLTPETFAGSDIDLDEAHQHPKTLLYLRDGLLEAQNHTVALTTLNSNEQRPLFFDYAVISGGNSLSLLDANASGAGVLKANNTSENSADKSTTSRKPPPPPTAAIVGATCGGLVLVAALLAFWFILKRSRRRRAQRPQEQGSVAPSSDATSYYTFTTIFSSTTGSRSSGVVSDVHGHAKYEQWHTGGSLPYSSRSDSPHNSSGHHSTDKSSRRTAPNLAASLQKPRRKPQLYVVGPSTTYSTSTASSSVPEKS